jgi:hypothetical protein
MSKEEPKEAPLPYQSMRIAWENTCEKSFSLLNCRKALSDTSIQQVDDTHQKRVYKVNGNLPVLIVSKES